jgi:hypothetical protein
MRIRIGSYADTYWLEKRCLFGWRRLSSLSYWLDLHYLKWDPENVAYYNSYEIARDEAIQFYKRFNPSAAIYSEVKA